MHVKFMAGSISFVLTSGGNEVLLTVVNNLQHNSIQNDYKRGQ